MDIKLHKAMTENDHLNIWSYSNNEYNGCHNIFCFSIIPKNAFLSYFWPPVSVYYLFIFRAETHIMCLYCIFLSYWRFFNVCSCHRDAAQVDSMRKTQALKSMMFPHWNIHKYTWTSPGGKTHNQTDYIFIARRWHSSILDVQFLRGADCGMDRCAVVANN
jgi:hypothetical protein